VAVAILTYFDPGFKSVGVKLMDSALFDGSTDIAYKAMHRKHVKTIIITIW